MFSQPSVVPERDRGGRKREENALQSINQIMLYSYGHIIHSYVFKSESKPSSYITFLHII